VGNLTGRFIKAPTPIIVFRERKETNGESTGGTKPSTKSDQAQRGNGDCVGSPLRMPLQHLLDARICEPMSDHVNVSRPGIDRVQQIASQNQQAFGQFVSAASCIE
jgi:hypothetical protein